MSITGQERTSVDSQPTPLSHTPGPWSIGHVRPQSVHKSLGAMWEAPIHVGEGATRGNCHTIVYGGGAGACSSAEQDVLANARLIAAAPDLLALAKQYANECARCGGSAEIVVNDHGDDPEFDYCQPCNECEDIRAVISKAEGRS